MFFGVLGWCCCFVMFLFCYITDEVMWWWCYDVVLVLNGDMMIIHISRNECFTIFSQGLRSGTDRLLRCRLQRRKRRLGSDWSGTLEEHFPCQDWLHWLFCSAGGGDCRGAQASQHGRAPSTGGIDKGGWTGIDDRWWTSCFSFPFP